MGSARAGHSATLLSDGRVLVAGGYETFQIGAEQGHQRALDSAEIYDPQSDSWQPAGVLGAKRSLHAATMLSNGMVLISGGHSMDSSLPGSDYQYHSSSEIFDPATGAFTLTASMNTARESHNAVRLPSGRVLATCGANDSQGMIGSCEIYNP